MDASKDLYIILCEPKGCPCLFWKENNEFFSDEVLGEGTIKNDRPIIALKRIFLPSQFSMHGWIDCKQRSTPDILYSSVNYLKAIDNCLTLEMHNNIIYMSKFYDREWINCESMGKYLNHKPTHWQYIPTADEMMKHYKI